MQPQIRNIKPFIIVGNKSRQRMPDVSHTHDIPAFWDQISAEYGTILTDLHQTFSESKHREYSVCLNINAETGEFDYLLGVGVDENEKSKITDEMLKAEMQGGLYAVFTTPLVAESKYPQSISDTWKVILTQWLPQSGYEYDESRPDFEYYDRRDHAWEHDNLVQMDIYIPITQKNIV